MTALKQLENAKVVTFSTAHADIYNIMTMFR